MKREESNPRRGEYLRKKGGGGRKIATIKKRLHPGGSGLRDQEGKSCQKKERSGKKEKKSHFKE